VVYIAHGGWGYTLGVIETGHVGWNMHFERCLEGSNDDPVVDPVVDVLEKEQHIPAGPGRTFVGKKQQRRDNGLKDRTQQVAITSKTSWPNLQEPMLVK
jgi:hypothetical protein